MKETSRFVKTTTTTETEQSKGEKKDVCRNKFLSPEAARLLLGFRAPDCLVTPSTHSWPYPYIVYPQTQTPPRTSGEESPPYVQHMLLTENKALFVLFHSFALSTLSGFLFSALRLAVSPPLLLCSLVLCQFGTTWNSVSLFYRSCKRKGD